FWCPGTGRRCAACRSSLPLRATLRSRWSGLQFHVGAEAVPAAFPADATFLVPAEWRGGVELVEGVRPDHAGAHAAGHLEDLRTLDRPHAAGKAVRGVVRFWEPLHLGAEGLDREHWAEDFLLHHPVRLRNPGKNGRSAPEAALRHRAGALVHLGALLLPEREVGMNALELRRRVDRTDVRVLVERVADDQ